MEFVYHFKPSNLLGTKLFPLNTLQKVHPEIAVEHSRKYKNRENTPQLRIPPLDCLWNDAIHLSPINPQIIYDLWRELKFDLPKEKLSVIRIPTNKLDENKTATFQPHGKNPVKDFSHFKHRSYRELKSVTQEQIGDWHDQKATGWPLFWYSSTLHVVTHDEIDISGCEIFPLK